MTSGDACPTNKYNMFMLGQPSPVDLMILPFFAINFSKNYSIKYMYSVKILPCVLNNKFGKVFCKDNFSFISISQFH
jgi:hypothetical protein